MSIDIYRYAGQITSQGYESICETINLLRDTEGLADRAILMLATPGGDPDAGFRIARALQHSYEAGFESLIPRECKSAGTMIVVGSTAIHMADQSELGPLDIQIKKGDELFGRNSGLDINQAVDFLKEEALTTFNNYMNKLVRQGLSTKVAADMAAKLVNGLFTPIAAQIEPLRLAEMQRAMNITYAYGRRLSAAGKNVRPRGLEQLVGAYPSHGFVIDRKEARNLFKQVLSPTAELIKLCDDFVHELAKHTNDAMPKVDSKKIPTDQGNNDDAQGQSVLGAPETSAGAVQPALNGARRKTRRSKEAEPAAA